MTRGNLRLKGLPEEAPEEEEEEEEREEEEEQRKKANLVESRQLKLGFPISLSQ